MTVIISAVFGLLSSFLPSIMDYFKQKKDQKHELAMLKMQQDFAERMKGQDYAHEQSQMELAGLFQLVMAETRAMFEQQKAILAHDSHLGDEMTRYVKTMLEYKPEAWFLKHLLWPLFIFAASPLICLAITLRYFVRAGVTYLVVCTWAAVKYAVYVSRVEAGAKWYEAMQTAWDDADDNIMAYVLGFWFGQKLQEGRVAFSKRFAKG